MGTVGAGSVVAVLAVVVGDGMVVVVVVGLARARGDLVASLAGWLVQAAARMTTQARPSKPDLVRSARGPAPEAAVTSTPFRPWAGRPRLRSRLTHVLIFLPPDGPP